jgi:hypothetical protein
MNNDIGAKVEIVLRTTDKASRELWRKRALSEADVRETASWLHRWYPGAGYMVERVETRIVGDGVKKIERRALAG